MVYFPAPGPDHTDATLQAARDAAGRLGIGHVVVATTSGATGVKAAGMFRGSQVRVVAVTHNTGFNEPGIQELDPGRRAEIEGMGGTVYTGTMVLRNLPRAIRNAVGCSDSEIVAQVLRMFGQGMKVCVEIAAMAADAGLVPPGDVIAVAGTGRGADTACVVAADASSRFFGIKVREILAKPRDF